MRFLLLRRFSYIDLLWLFAAMTFGAHGQFIAGVITILVGTLFVILLERLVLHYDKNRAWQTLVKKDRMASAIKLYRDLHGVGLKEAVDAVRNYRNKVENMR